MLLYQKYKKNALNDSNISTISKKLKLGGVMALRKAKAGSTLKIVFLSEGSGVTRAYAKDKWSA